MMFRLGSKLCNGFVSRRCYQSKSLAITPAIEMFMDDLTLPTASTKTNTHINSDSELIIRKFNLNLDKNDTDIENSIKPLILYDDNRVLLVYKPNGLVVNPSIPSSSSSSNLSININQYNDYNNNLISLLKDWLIKEYKKPGNAFLAPCHFIDQAVSGILVLAKTSKAARRIQETFSSRHENLKKKYLCVVHGSIPIGNKQILEHSIRNLAHKENKVNGKRVVVSERQSSNTRSSKITDNNKRYKKFKNAKEDWKDAKLSYESLYTFTTSMNSPMTLLHVELETGHKHQIRAQLAHIGHSIVGDTQYSLYNDESDYGRNNGKNNKKFIALHAYHLSLPHPTAANKIINVEAMAPDYWKKEFNQEVYEKIENLIMKD